MTYFSFIDQHPNTVPTPQRPVDANLAMTDWTREDRLDRREAVQGRVNTVKRIGAKAVIPIVALALAAGIVHESAGAAGSEEAAAAHKAAPIEKALDHRIPRSPANSER
ncbi:MAG TPA: hypothetical protein VFH99_00605 [Candidatus Saccharimonadales bacterium]|nr:hypothetical protein [Candidatus Saccharimonadales bacterium]